MTLPVADLKALLTAQKADALSGQMASLLATERTDALDYYMGDMSKDMPSIDGRSRAVSTDVADIIDGMMPSMMEIFCGGDEVVKFAPVGPEDEQAAEQETDYVNHVFMQQNPGFLILYSFIKDALLSKNGIVKIFVEEGEKEERKTFYDQPDDAYGLILSEPGIEIVAHTAKPDPSAPPPDPSQPAPPDQKPPMLHDITVSCKKPYTKVRVDPVPPEEFGISRNAKNIREASYCFHEVKRSQADLIGQGFDRDQIEKLPSYAAPARIEESARDTVGETTERIGSEETMNKAMRQIRVTEHYVRMDYEEDGHARLYRVTTGGEQGEVLIKDGKPDINEEDMPRFAAMTPIIVTHRFFGRSIADLVMDIQRIKTALLRAVLDNAYLANNARAVVSEDDANESTLDDLLVSRPGGVVRVKRNAQTAIAWQQVPTIGNHVFPLIEYQDMVKEQRTGVGRQAQGIDADALQNQSATAVNQLFSAAQARIRLIARIFAETGIKDLFWLLHGVIRTHGKKAETVKLRNQWVPIDPREFISRDDLTVSVGLGYGGKAQRTAQIMAFLGFQKEVMMGGMTEVIQPKHIYNSGKELLKLMEIKNTEDFIQDPSSPEGQQAAQNKPPPPHVAEAQGKMQVEQAKVQAHVQGEQAKTQVHMQVEQAKLQASTQNDTAKIQLEGQLKREQMVAEFALRREQMTAEFALKREQMMLDHTVKLEAAHLNASAKVESSKNKSDGITDTRMGGEVG